MDKNHSDSQENKSGLVHIFSRLDTQSAIVAAIAISAGTFLLSGFVDLCNYIYWSAYFNRFDIPLAYYNDAIVHTVGLSKDIIIWIPIFILGWIMFFIDHIYLARIFKKQTSWADRLFYIFVVVMSCCIFVFGLALLNSSNETVACTLVLLELIVYIAVAFFKWLYKKLGNQAAFSQKAGWTLRIFSLILVLYLIFGHVYMAGSQANYNDHGLQTAQFVSTPDLNMENLHQNGEVQAQLILLETDDSYYVAEVTVKAERMQVGKNPETGNILETSIFAVDIIGNYPYRFIEKTDCSVMATIVSLNYYAFPSENESTFVEDLFFKLNYFTGGNIYVLTAVEIVFILCIICALCIPIAKKTSVLEELDPEEEKISEPCTES